jgi:hypothetical protein
MALEAAQNRLVWEEESLTGPPKPQDKERA